MLDTYSNKRRESIKNALLFFKNYQFNRFIIHVALCIVLLLGFVPALQGQLVSVGVMAFHDESGSGMPEELRLKIARDLQQVLVGLYSDLYARVIGTQLDSASIKNMSVPQLTQYGEQQGVKFLVRGGLLAISSENTGSGVKVSMDLYAEIIDTASGQTKGVRARGVGTQGVTYPTAKVPWEAIDITGSGFQYSAPGQALLNAVEQLAGQVHEAVTSPLETTAESQETETSTEETTEVEISGEETPEEETTESEEFQYTEEETEAGSEAASDEELQQLIYQAEELSYNSSLSEENLKALTKALENIKNSLEKKVTLIEQGKDTTEVEQDIATQKDELQQIITTITEAVSTSEEGEPEEEQYYETESGEKKNLLSSIGSVLDDSLNIIQKIQEIKSTLKGAEEEELYETEETEETTEEEELYETEETEETTEEEELYETEETEETTEGELAEVESTDEVSGVVTEDGEPVEGVTVTDPESGVSTTTDSSGYYNLGKIPAGRLSELVISKGSKQLATGKVNLVPGRAAVADWELKPKFSKDKKPALRVMPSMVNIAKGKEYKKFSGKTGTIKGVVLDAHGKPMARALVELKGLGTARTNSKGQYVFMKVPAGNHQLVVTKSGLNSKSQPINVLAKKSSSVTIRFASKDIIRKKAALPTLVTRGTTTTLFGKVTNVQNQPVKGAKVMAIQSGRAVSVVTGRSGLYRMKGLKPGKYRVLVSKTGFKSKAQDILLKSKRARKADFKLSGSSAYIRSLLAKKPVKKAPVVNVGTGKLIGRIINALSKKPLSSAVIRVKGNKGTASGRSGSYSITNLPAGTYRVNVSKNGYYSQSKNIRVSAKRTTRVDFALKPMVSKARIRKSPTLITIKKGQIRGFVANSKTRKGIAGATISISGLRSFSTNRSGSFISPQLAARTYRVTVSKTGYSSSSKTVKVQAGRTSNLTFYLTPRMLKLR
jgi:hypothetical protein